MEPTAIDKWKANSPSLAIKSWWITSVFVVIAALTLYVPAESLANVFFVIFNFLGFITAIFAGVTSFWAVLRTKGKANIGAIMLFLLLPLIILANIIAVAWGTSPIFQGGVFVIYLVLLIVGTVLLRSGLNAAPQQEEYQLDEYSRNDAKQNENDSVFSEPATDAGTDPAVAEDSERVLNDPEDAPVTEPVASTSVLGATNEHAGLDSDAPLDADYQAPSPTSEKPGENDLDLSPTKDEPRS